MEFSGENWKEVNVRAGAFFELPLTANHRLNLTTKLTAGICKTARPGYDWELYKQDGTFYSAGTDKKINLPWGVCYQAALALKYKLGNHLYVMLEGNYYNAFPRKEFNTGSYPYFEGGRKHFDINTINAMAGIGIDF